MLLQDLLLQELDEIVADRHGLVGITSRSRFPLLLKTVTCYRVSLFAQLQQQTTNKDKMNLFCKRLANCAATLDLPQDGLNVNDVKSFYSFLSDWNQQDLTCTWGATKINFKL